MYRSYNMILIDTIQGFSNRNIFIEYYVILPDEWKYDCQADKENPDWSYGITNTTLSKSTRNVNTGTLGFLIEFPLITKKPNKENIPLHWPQILFQVHSYSYFGRFNVEGYGTLDFPRSAGTHQIQVHTVYLL